MKRTCRNFFLLQLFGLLCCVINAQLPWEYTVKQGMWDYPVKPGTEEWRQSQSYEAKVKACQIPEEVLTSLSTDDLTELCLRYPFFTDFLVFDNPKAGLNKLINNFNGIRELYHREDVSTSLTKKYVEKIQTLSFLESDHPDIEKGFFVLYVSIFEVLLSRLEWDHMAENEEPKEVLRSLVAGFEGKLNCPDCFSGLFETNFYARANIISKMDKSFIEQLPNNDENAVLHSGLIRDEKTFKLINEYSYQLIK